MSRRTRFGRSLRDGAFVALALAAVGLAAFLWGYEKPERPVRLRMSAGRVAGERHRIAEELKHEAARRLIRIDLRETAGTDAALGELDTHRLDVVLAQGGLDLTDRPNLRQVATLHVEPLHLLVKQEHYAAIAERLSALRGKVVGLGERGSGTYALASEVMAFAGLDIRQHTSEPPFTISTQSYEELKRETDIAKLPDAVFMVSTLPSPIARHLVTVHGYRLVPLPFHEAFTLGALDEETAPARRSSERVARIDRRHVYAASIPAYTYEVEPVVPPKLIETLGTRLLVVAHKDVSAQTIQRLLDVVFASPFAQTMAPPLDPKLLELPPELERHDGTAAFLKRNTPLIADDAVDLIEKEISIIGATLGGLFFFIQWIRRRYRRRRDRGFEAYILRVTDIERRAMAVERSAALDLASLLELQEELSHLKGEALEKFADGVLEGEELMSGFLTHVSDTRDYLTRLILHKRDSLEEQAQAEGREAQSLWREAAGPQERAENDELPKAPTAESAGVGYHEGR
jgi:TRAP-type uncharacterized transport system substrate-binding protein